MHDELPQCRHYEPWNLKSTILKIQECCHFSPLRQICHCPECERYNQPCLYFYGVPK